MDEPISLDNLFKDKIFRIPDYQRGYAWQKSQLKDFWEDLINLSESRSHYTGVLTLKELSNSEVKEMENEYWLIEDHSYKLYHIVDGQQRLTTFVIFLQAFINFIKELPENINKEETEIFITGSLTLQSVMEKYLFKINPSGNNYRTYKFGYAVDNPSYEYLRYKIFKEEGAGSYEETFYTLNLNNASCYFLDQFKEFYAQEGISGLSDIYKKLTKRFLFNEYVIKDEFDVFVAFETINNRGKKLSDLELLKNRLIYLTTLYSEQELTPADRKSIRDDINSAWKEIYHQLGRNTKRPLNDDDFLKAHWIMYFKFSRKKGNDYIKFLLDEEFSPQKVHKKVEGNTTLELPEEQDRGFDFEDRDDESEEFVEDTQSLTIAQLPPLDIREYVNSLKTSVVHWFNSFYPHFSTRLDDSVKETVDKLNRIGIGYFRPLVMSLLKNVTESSKLVDVLNLIERFIFIEFKLCQTKRNYRDSEFYNFARAFDKKEKTLDNLNLRLESLISLSKNLDGSFKIDYFYNYLKKLFSNSPRMGYKSWHGIRYFLYEYELSLLSGSRQKKVSWDDLLKKTRDRISIEHICPQTLTAEWLEKFGGIEEKDDYKYQGSIGNLLLLSSSINSSLQNDNFNMKKDPKYNEKGEKIRNGYSDGSHSEIEVSKYPDWTPDAIKERGMKLLKFMEKRWEIDFKDENEMEKLLFLN